MKPTGLSVIDRSVHFLDEPPELWKHARPAPLPPSCLSARVKPPSFPRKMKAPWGGDNVYGGVPCYQEPGKPWILGVGYFCGYGADTGTGATDYRAFYTVSNDGGRTFCEPRPVIAQGSEFDLMHPLPGAWVGKNSWAFTDAMLTNLASNGDLVLPLFSCLTTRAANGDVIVPFTLWPLDADGTLHRVKEVTGEPCDFWTSGALIGRWTPDGSDMLWDMGQLARGDDHESTRGLCEPAIAELKRKGEFIMVMRGANQRSSNPDLKGYRWISYSGDTCRTWSKPVPWTTTDGKAFFSPASCSAFQRSGKNGRLYWIGNIVPSNPIGCNPRWPLVIAEVDEDKKALVRESILVIDTWNPAHDKELLELSNFAACEDPDTGHILITLKRVDWHATGYYNCAASSADWFSPPWERFPSCWYLVAVPEA